MTLAAPESGDLGGENIAPAVCVRLAFELGGKWALTPQSGKTSFPDMPKAPPPKRAEQNVSIEGAVQELLDAQHAYELLRAAIEQPLANATLRREDAMRKAADLGLSRRRIADMTGISHTRVIQILDAQPRRREIMAELATLSGHQLADRLLALALSNSLSRGEMSEATGLSVDAVNQMIREYAERRAHARNAAALEMVKRHMPNFGEHF